MMLNRDTNHEEAHELACMKRDESNLARCYLELRDVLSLWLEGYDDAMGGGDLNERGAIMRAREILRTNTARGKDEGSP